MWQLIKHHNIVTSGMSVNFGLQVTGSGDIFNEKERSLRREINSIGQREFVREAIGNTN